MSIQVKPAIESALVSALVAATCLWLMLSADELDAVHATLYGVGIGVSLVAHWTFMVLALRASGRCAWCWLPGLVLLCPVVSVVALVLMHHETQNTPAGAGTPPQG